MKNLKKFLFIFLVVILCFGIIGFFKIKSESNKAINSIEISNVNLFYIDDGSYVGDCSYGPCSAKIKVSVKNHQIQQISILEHKNGIGSKAEAIIDDVINKQSIADVDTISGATVSSKVILKATENALLKGVN